MKKLRVKFQKNCNGCELCSIEAQRQLGIVGLNGSSVRVFKQKVDGEITFEINLDSSVNNLDIEKIKDICPNLVFTIEEVGETDDEL